MAISPVAREKIIKLIDEAVEMYVLKAKKDPKKGSGNPFTVSLLRDFEPITHRVHGLRTTLGSQFEKIAEIIAVDAWGVKHVKRKTNRSIKLPKNVFQVINTIVSSLNNKKSRSNYHQELKQIQAACRIPSEEIDEFEEQTYEFDLEIHDPKKNHHYFLEMKGPDPNTTEVPGAKRRLLAEFAWGILNKQATSIDTYLAIYYNNVYPKSYTNAKVLYYFEPAGLLVHDQFWNFIGRDKNTFAQLVEIFAVYGAKNKKRMWDSFFALIGRK